MPALLIDTDVFIDHLRGAHELKISATVAASYSTITRCELFAGTKDDDVAIHDLLSAFGEVPVDRAVAERAGRMRRSGGLRTPDALIAATAVEHGLVLMTRNVRDFSGADDLQVQQPR